jgi:hypothetical protein
MAELTLADEWNWDANSGYHKTNETKQHRSKKVQKPLVLQPPTKEHPAQTMMITDDVIVGYWHTVKISGAIKRTDKKALLSRIEMLSNAVKQAREQANSTKIESQHHGKAVMDFLFNDFFTE